MGDLHGWGMGGEKDRQGDSRGQGERRNCSIHFPKAKKAEEEVRASALVYINSLHDHILDLLECNKMLVY